MEATVVSIYPLAIREFKPGQNPDTYFIPACENKNSPQSILVKDAIDQRFVGGEFRTVDIPIDGVEIARSIVEDFVSSLMYTDETARPGVFFFPGKATVTEILSSEFLVKAKTRQLLWYDRLIRQADDDWAKWHNSRFIMDIQRIAAKELGVEREWLSAIDEAKTEKCFACRTLVDAAAIVCPQCRAVLKKKEFESLKFAGA